MGTRGAILFAKGKKVIGSYNHYDSYPEGLGSEVLEVLKKVSKKNLLNQLGDNVKKLKAIDTEKKPSKELQERYSKFADLHVSNQTLDDWYCLLRNVQGANCIMPIATGELEHISDDTSFVKDSLFCEYAYLIDFDKKVLELYRGFQHKAQKGNRFGTKPGKKGDYEGAQAYYPCAKVGEISFEQIEKGTPKKLEKEMIKLYNAFAKANGEEE